MPQIILEQGFCPLKIKITHDNFLTYSFSKRWKNLV